MLHENHIQEDTMAPNTNKYRPRIVDQRIERVLLMIGAIQIRGPKWCGKTNT